MDDELRRFKPDEVILSLLNIRFMGEFNAAARTRTNDDISTPGVDPEWPALSGAERRKSWGPITRELEHFLKTTTDPSIKGHFYFDGNDRLIGGLSPEMLGNEGLTAIVVKFYVKLFRKISDYASKHGVKVTLCMIPTSNMISGGETVKSFYNALPTFYISELRDAATQSGLGFIDLSPEIKMISPAEFPLFAPSELAHFTYNGAHFAGMTAAWKYLGLGSPPPAPDPVKRKGAP